MANHHLVRIMPFYLLKTDGTGVAHLWDGKDTLCSMFSSSDWQKEKWAMVEEEKIGNHKLCKNCQAVEGKYRKRDW